MRLTLTHIHVILDRTGSMASIRDDVVGGFNAFVEEQRHAPGLATLTLVQFDSVDPYEVVFRALPIDRVPQLTRETYVPRASTPLLDAIGRGIADLDTALASLHRAERPDRVLFVVITDGNENASREFDYARVERMVRSHREKNDWEFVFLGADLAAIADAGRLGFAHDATLAFDADAEGIRLAMKSLSRVACEARSAPERPVAFDDDDRSAHESSSWTEMTWPAAKDAPEDAAGDAGRRATDDGAADPGAAANGESGGAQA